jgi:mxaJ protein
MSGRCLRGLVAFALLSCPAWGQRVLRVCADPNNLPFSNQRGEGFENRLAEMVARELHATLAYAWLPQRKNFLRNTLEAGRCDLAFGVPEGLRQAGVATTVPYYRSSYVLVSRSGRSMDIRSLDDPRLRGWRIGMHVVGDDYAPPAYALARRGMTGNIVGFSLFGPAGEPDPPARIFDAVEQGKVDVAIVWGPLGGYFAKERGTLSVAPLPAAPEFRAVPAEFGIAAAVRNSDSALHDEVERALAARRHDIRELLHRYGVPVSRDEHGGE